MGPIAGADIDFAFGSDGSPIPTILLGTNGSGKSVALSLIANALVAMQQTLFENAEVQAGRVYKLRSPRYVRGGARHYWATVVFDNGAQFSEWQLSTTREAFEAALSSAERARLEALHGWGSIPVGGTSVVEQNFGTMEPALRQAWNTQAMLFFPADRHELPAWLNEDDLKYRPKYAADAKLDRRTNRRVVRNVVLKDVMDWILDVVLDARMGPVSARPQPGGTVALVYDNPVELMILNLLSLVTGASQTGPAQLTIGNRHLRSVGRNFYDDKGNLLATNSLLSLSSGEAQLFTLFASILMDFDKSGSVFKSFSDVRGIVLIDEADMHLHIGLQATVLPNLIKAFPNIQFLITTHSPLLVIGLERELGAIGPRLLQMPGATATSAENFSEFNAAFAIIAETQAYRDRAQALRSEGTPLLLTEGESDARLISTAWRKLNPSVACPFRVKDAGIDDGKGGRSGGAARLLPVPPNRLEFRHLECGRPGKWHVEIEHYFANATLLAHALVCEVAEAKAGRPFTLNDGAKMDFAKKAGDLPVEEFKQFGLLFEKLRAIGFIPP